MSLFTGSLTVTELDVNNRLWRLEHELVYEVGSLGSGRVISVNSGFITDGASVPRILWALLPTWGRYSRAAVVHDFLCWRLRIGLPHPEARTRAQADAVFYEAMGVLQVNYFRRFALWAGARIGGLL